MRLPLDVPVARWIEDKEELRAEMDKIRRLRPLILGFDTETKRLRDRDEEALGYELDEDDEVDEYLEKALKKKMPLDPRNQLPVLWSFSYGHNRFCCPGELLHTFEDVLVDEQVAKTGANVLMYDNRVIGNVGLELRGDLFELLHMDWLADENRKGRHGLKHTARDYCGIEMRPFNQVVPGEPDIMKWPHDLRVAYASLDAYASWRVCEALYFRLDGIPTTRDESLLDLYLDVELPYLWACYEMTTNGAMVDSEYLKGIRPGIVAELQEIKREFNKTLGKPINLDSHPQLRRFFYGEECGICNETGKVTCKECRGNGCPFCDDGTIKCSECDGRGYATDVDHNLPEEVQADLRNFGFPKKIELLTDGGSTGVRRPTTKETVLKQWREEGCPFSAKLLRYRSVRTTLSRYVDGWVRFQDKGGRIHSQYGTHVIVTGRLSSKNPATMNVPRPDNDEFTIRRAFVAPPGKILLVGDLSQAEMRVMAHESGDERMQEVIVEGMEGVTDLHFVTAYLMFGQTGQLDFSLQEAIEAKAAKKRAEAIAEMMGRDPDMTLEEAAVLADGPGPTDRQRELLQLRQASKSTGFGLLYGEGPTLLAQQVGVSVTEARGLQELYFNTFPGVREFVQKCHKMALELGYVRTSDGRIRRLPQASSSDGGLAARALRQSQNFPIQGLVASILRRIMARCVTDQVFIDVGSELILQIHDEVILELDDKPELVEVARPALVDVLENSYQLSVPMKADVAAGYTWAECH